jgi:hypothetical protein
MVALDEIWVSERGNPFFTNPEGKIGVLFS